MHRVFNIALLVGSISLACTQSVSALYMGHGVPTVPAARALVEDFNQQANYQRAAIESIDRQDYQTLLSAQKDPIEKVPLPFPEPLPAIPRS